MNKGFTLIEMMVVIIIIAICTAGGYITYTRTYQENKFKKDVSDFTSVLELAKERSIRKDMTPSSTCTTLRGYDILLTTPNIYQVRFICAGVPDTYTLLSPQYQLSTTNFYNVATGSTIPFYTPYGCLDQNCNTTTSTISIQNPNITNRCIIVTINNAGTILTSDPTTCS